MQLSKTIQSIIALANKKGIVVKAASAAEMDRYGKGTMGCYNPRKRLVLIRKGLTVRQAEETILHELAHAVWSALEHKVDSLKKRVKLGILQRMSIMWDYKNQISNWDAEMFAHYFENKPTEVYSMLKAL